MRELQVCLSSPVQVRRQAGRPAARWQSRSADSLHKAPERSYWSDPRPSLHCTHSGPVGAQSHTHTHMQNKRQKHTMMWSCVIFFFCVCVCMCVYYLLTRSFPVLCFYWSVSALLSYIQQFVLTLRPGQTAKLGWKHTRTHKKHIGTWTHNNAEAQ